MESPTNECVQELFIEFVLTNLRTKKNLGSGESVISSLPVGCGRFTCMWLLFMVNAEVTVCLCIPAHGSGWENPRIPGPAHCIWASVGFGKDSNLFQHKKWCLSSKVFFSLGRLKENQSVYLVLYLWIIIICLHIMYRFVSNKTILTPHPLNLLRWC